MRLYARTADAGRGAQGVCTGSTISLRRRRRVGRSSSPYGRSSEGKMVPTMCTVSCPGPPAFRAVALGCALHDVPRSSRNGGPPPCHVVGA
ncbi:unnamed protein product [Lampetra fluviatilis]